LDLHADAHSPAPIRRLIAKAPTNVIQRGGLPAGAGVAEHPGVGRFSGRRSQCGDARHRGSQAKRVPGAPPPSGGAAALVQPRSASGPTRHGVAGEADSMLKYLTGQTCAEGDGWSVIELEAVACQHRIPTGLILVRLHHLRGGRAVPERSPGRR
jgi:hypothetical protein